MYEKRGQKEQAINHWRQRVELGDPNDPWTKDATEHLRILVPTPAPAIEVGR